MKVTSMNHGDCFILDTADTIYVWAGRKSRRTERLKATQAAAQIRDSDHGGKATIHILGKTDSRSESLTPNYPGHAQQGFQLEVSTHMALNGFWFYFFSHFFVGLGLVMRPGDLI